MPVSCFTEVDFDNLSRYYRDKLPRFPNRDHGELLRTDPYHGLSVQPYRALEGGYIYIAVGTDKKSDKW